jgi:Tfp pilus assembly protein PilX
MLDHASSSINLVPNGEELPSEQDELKPLLVPGTCLAHRPDRGFVLVLVLCWLAVLTFLAAQITAATRAAVSISANIRNSAVAEALADGAVHEAIFRVVARQWQADGAIHIVRAAQAVAEV